jgi:two-component system, chemotaxis family, protein-glutamate methylesterase/glutaminase
MTGTRIRAVAVVPDPAPIIAALQRERDIAVVGHASDVSAALALVANARPDIVVLDLAVGRSRGRDLIEQLMNRTPTPILVLAPGTAERGSPSVVEALVAGALEALPAPATWSPASGAELRETVRRLSAVRVIRHLRGSRPPQHDEPPTGRTAVVAMAASTGGPSALATILAGLAGLPAPVLVVQHLHPEFTSGLHSWMSRVSALPVEIAEDAHLARPGRVYLAPSGTHLRLGPTLHLELDPEPETTHRPSADVLFTSVADAAGPSAIGVLLTGMGEDGARGLLAIHEKGGQTIGQDEESCAVFGMPRAAQRLGAVSDLRPLPQLAAAVRRAVRVAGIGART